MNIKDNITRVVCLEQNDGLSAFKGVGAQQHQDAYEVFYSFLSEIQPSRILEIGTGQGGLTQFLKLACNHLNIAVDILSYDVVAHDWFNDMRLDGIDIRIENVFNNDYTSVKLEVSDFIIKDGVTLVMCDGLYKIREFNLLSKFLKHGDFIMAHDYVDTRESFEHNFYQKRWNWHEISDSDINEACITNKLESYNKEAFDTVMWVCKKK